jgi:hypothetical protein
MNRRSFFSVIASAFAGTAIARLFKKAEPYSVTLETGPSFEVWPQNPESWDMPGVQVFCELPEQITGLHVSGDYLLAFTATGIYEIHGDGSYEKLDDPILTIDDFSERYLTPLESV